MTGRANKDDLGELHGALARAIKKRIESGDATAADLAVARQFLKDNGIDAVPGNNPDLDAIKEALPFSGTHDPDEVED